jgi:hypothetical protein
MTTLSIMALSIKCHHAECRDCLNVMLNVVMLSVVAPIKTLADLNLNVTNKKGLITLALGGCRRPQP